MPKTAVAVLFLSWVSWAASAMAVPVLTTTELAAFQQACLGVVDPTLAQSRGQKLLVIKAAGGISELHDALPAALRAERGSEVGAVVCLTELRQVTGHCAYNIFVNLAQVQRDYQVTALALSGAQTRVNAGLLAGAAPLSCAKAGVRAANSQIIGLPPTGMELNRWLDQVQLGIGDSDQDGYSDLAEFLLGSNPNNSATPGARVSVQLRNYNQSLTQGSAIRVALSFNPGPYLKQTAKYFLYATGNGMTWSYQYPGGMLQGGQAEPAVVARAMVLNEFELSVLKGLPAGDYTLTFAVQIQDEIVSSDATNISVKSGVWHFSDVTSQAGFAYSHGYATIARESARDLQVIFGGGVASGDYDRDGWTDLYVTRGSAGPNLLFRNLGDGRFAEVGAAAGVALTGNYAGTTFADYDGDGWLDLIVTAFAGDQLKLFHNQGDGTFKEGSQLAGFPTMKQSLGASFADIDHDGDLDLWLNHWFAAFDSGYLWRNNGDGTFTDISLAAGIDNSLMADFTTNFADINNDGWADVVVTGDYGSSQIFINQHNSHFKLATSAVITDENGMGAAVADYDNDGDLDWFVSSIYDYAAQSGVDTGVPFGSSGNRLYQNQGDGKFKDVTQASGVRIGSWGWGSCFADFNNDTHPDIFQVNGYSGAGHATVAAFEHDFSVMFIADGSGRFTSRAFDLGLVDNQQGRGIVCFDYDQDGDIDLFIANNEQPPRLYRNDGGNAGNYLQVQLEGEGLNSQAIGARIYVTIGKLTQMRELQAGNNYMSQNPVVAHFGLGAADLIDELRVVWPSGAQQLYTRVQVNRALWISHP